MVSGSVQSSSSDSESLALIVTGALIIWKLGMEVIAVVNGIWNALWSRIFLKRTNVTLAVISYIALKLCRKSIGTNHSG